MNWLDFFALGGFALLLSIAYAQGVILEITQVVALVVGGLFGFRSFRTLAESLHSSVFSGWTLGFLHKLCFFCVFGAVFLTIFSIGLTIERRAKEEHMIEKLTDRRLGLFVGFFKSAWLISLLLGLFFYLDMVPERRLAQTRRGPVVSMLLGLKPLVAPTAYIMAPSDLAKDYVKVGLEGKKRRKKKKKKKKKGKKKSARAYYETAYHHSTVHSVSPRLGPDHDSRPAPERGKQPAGTREGALSHGLRLGEMA